MKKLFQTLKTEFESLTALDPVILFFGSIAAVLIIFAGHSIWKFLFN